MHNGWNKESISICCSKVYKHQTSHLLSNDKYYHQSSISEIHRVDLLNLTFPNCVKCECNFIAISNPLLFTTKVK